MRLQLLLAAVCHVAAGVTSGGAQPSTSLYWPLKGATSAGGAPLTYEERALALAFQGIVNNAGAAHATLLVDAGALDFDWPKADEYWHETLQKQGRVAFAPALEPTLCALVAGGDPNKRVKGLVAYPSSGGDYGDGYSLALALTVAGQQQLLPVDAGTLERNPCLAQRHDIMYDLRTVPEVKAGRASAWRWAFENLLPAASKSTVYNLWRYRDREDPDPQRNATAATIAVGETVILLTPPPHPY